MNVAVNFFDRLAFLIVAVAFLVIAIRGLYVHVRRNGGEKGEGQ